MSTRTTAIADYLAYHKKEVSASASMSASPGASTSKLYYFIAPPVSRSSSNTSSASTSSGKPSRSNSTNTSGCSSCMTRSSSDYTPSNICTLPSPSVSSASTSPKAGSDLEAYFASQKRSKRGSISSLSPAVLASPPSSPCVLASSPPCASAVQESGCISSCRCTRTELGDFVFDNEEEYRIYVDILTQAQKDGMDLSSSSFSPTSPPVLRVTSTLSQI